MTRFWMTCVLLAGLCAFGVFAVNCSSGGDDDDDGDSSSDDDDDDDDDASDDDDSADDDADDDVDDDGPTEEECTDIWYQCRLDYPVATDDEVSVLCGEEPAFNEDNLSPYMNWKMCVTDRLQSDYRKIDGCGYFRGCDDEKHQKYSCESDYNLEMWFCAAGWTTEGNPNQELAQYEVCESRVEGEYWCSDTNESE